MSDPYVFHFVLTHDGADKERLSTLCLEPEAVRRVGPLYAIRAVQTERRRWQRIVLARLGEGWAVRIVKERGYVRSVFPGAALRSKSEVATP
jgi:hypothetical protein